jgi:hypothetical protein
MGSALTTTELNNMKVVKTEYRNFMASVFLLKGTLGLIAA